MKRFATLLALALALLLPQMAAANLVIKGGRDGEF